MKITVIGAGYVGLVSGTCFAELGHQVVVVDNNMEKIEALQRGIIPIYEQLLPELVKKHSGASLLFSTDIKSAFQKSDVAFVCVGTPPSSNGDADLSYVEAVARDLASSLGSHKIIVEKSTVPVGTCDAVRRTMILSGADPEQFSIASNPEFLREGTAVTDFLYPDRILLGVGDERSQQVLTEIYRPLISGSYYELVDRVPPPADLAQPHAVKLIVSSVKSAEMIKHASNAFLALKISFINAVSNICERVGADVREVAIGVGSDSRIGSKFLQPGIGYGGSCFPKDVQAFRSVARQVGYDFNLLTDVIQINEQQKVRFIGKVREALWTLRGKRLAVLGLAFKGGTDDVRDSPALDIIRLLVAEGASVVAYDPAAMDRASVELAGLNVTYAEDAYSACANADALLILSEWPAFARLDLQRVRNLLALPILLDGKNLLDPIKVAAAGISYFSVGSRSQHVTVPTASAEPRAEASERLPSLVRRIA
jgi:UDPglucose 6-dehydrogenase